MHRILFALFLIAALVACPLRCRNCFADDIRGESTATAGCACCAHDPAEVPSGSNDPFHEDDCRCQDCLCDGAVISLKFELSGDSEEIGAPLQGNSLALSGKQARPAYPPERPACSGALLYGRRARIVHQSLLN